tara:strand:+ start:738 stop:977 length:240 start_codon:yes stop_codon:yes gene_type:complete
MKNFDVNNDIQSTMTELKNLKAEYNAVLAGAYMGDENLIGDKIERVANSINLTIEDVMDMDFDNEQSIYSEFATEGLLS